MLKGLQGFIFESFAGEGKWILDVKLWHFLIRKIRYV
jgi:hypothetical protein